MAKNPDKTPFWRELYYKLEGEIGSDNIFIGLMLGGLVTTIYWKGCKR